LIIGVRIQSFFRVVSLDATQVEKILLVSGTNVNRRQYLLREYLITVGARAQATKTDPRAVNNKVTIVN
ncbi:hypothetical protein AB4142_38365, partial [Variovorax sp. 2RAF20]